MKKENIKALQFVSRFSLPPNALGYCGKDSAPAKLNSCIISGKCAGVKKELEKFPVLHPYLKTISEITGFPKFSKEVVEAYWIGNDLLKKCKPEHYNILIRNFETQGIPDFLIKELRSNPPKAFIPTHLFQVLHVGVGRITGSVPFNLDSVNNCMVRWGNVTEILDGKLAATFNLLVKNGNRFETTKSDGVFDFNKGFLPGLKKGSTVAIHWKQVIKKLTDEETKKLDFWANETLRTL